MILGRLHRITSAGSYIPEIDGLRFVAIFVVFLFHTLGQLTVRCGLASPAHSILVRLISYGTRGVEVFFVISGFVVFLPFAKHYLAGKKKVSLSNYAVRRVTRLAPPYVVSILLYAVLLALLNHVQWRQLLPHLLASLFYVHNLVFGSVDVISPVAWSLEVEIQFYCVAPLIALLMAVRQPFARRFLILLLMVVSGILQLHYVHTRYAEMTLLANMQFFLAGLLAADLYVCGWVQRGKSLRRLSFGWDLLSLSIWPLIFYIRSTGFREIVLPWFVLLVIAAAFCGTLFRYILTRPFLTVTGGMCYTVYLYHFMLISAVSKLSRKLFFAGNFWENFIIQAAIMFAVVWIVCAALFLLIEQPCMDKTWPTKLRNRLQNRKPAPPVVVAAEPQIPRL